jgi:hypothetical protein
MRTNLSVFPIGNGVLSRRSSKREGMVRSLAVLQSDARGHVP